MNRPPTAHSLHPFTQKERDLDFEDDSDMFLPNSLELQQRMGYSPLMQPRPAQSSSSPLWSRQAQSESFSYSNKENLDSKFLQPSGNSLRSATHQDLLGAGNEAYEKLYSSFILIRGCYSELRAQYHQLAESTTRAPSAILAPASAPALFQIPDLGRFDTKQYPNVKFATRDAYNKHTAAKAATKKVTDPTAEGGGSKDKDLAVTDFIETENGAIVTGDTAKAIRNLARSVLIKMDSHPMMQLPRKWGQVGVTE
ncbi:hypothetical protein B0H34DRAFT_770235, partial [Crassisporium funariophilum]